VIVPCFLIVVVIWSAADVKSAGPLLQNDPLNKTQELTNDLKNFFALFFGSLAKASGFWVSLILSVWVFMNFLGITGNQYHRLYALRQVIRISGHWSRRFCFFHDHNFCFYGYRPC
jgi:hypothetical protein